jgi:hypothetical protein
MLGFSIQLGLGLFMEDKPSLEDSLNSRGLSVKKSSNK